MTIPLPDRHPGSWIRISLLPAQAGPAITLLLLAPVAPAIADHFGAGGTDAAQKIITFPFLGLVIGSLLSGAAIRMTGLKPLILIASLAFVLSGIIGLLADDLPLLLVGGTLLGLGAAWMTSALSGVTSTLYEDDARARLVSHQSASGNLIAACLGLLSAALASRLGWRTPFGAFALFGLAIALLASSFIPAIPRDKQARGIGFIAVLKRIWPVCLAGSTVYAIATNQSTNLPFLLAAHGIDSAALRSLVTITTSMSGMAGAFGYGQFQARIADRWMILISTALGSSGWFLFAGWHGGLALAMVGAGLIGLCIGMLMPMLFMFSMRAVDSGASGAAIGLLTAFIFLGSFVSPVLFTPVRQIAGLSGMMVWVGASTILAGLCAAARVKIR